MAITTIDGTLAGMKPLVPVAKASTAPTSGAAGIPFSLWATAGFPSASTGVSASTGTNLTSTAAQVTGQIFHSNPASGNAYLARLSGICTVSGVLILADRLQQAGNSSTGTLNLTITTAQSLGAALPSRDANGNTAGIGVLAGLEVTTVLSGNGTTSTAVLFTYTNSTGTASRTANLLTGIPSAAVPGTFVPFQLASGDIGVQQGASITISSAWTSGAVELVYYRTLAYLELPAANVANSIDALTAGFPQIFNGAVPYLIYIPNSTSALQFSGGYIETQG